MHIRLLDGVQDIMSTNWSAVQDEVTGLLSDLVRFKTVNPPGEETACAQYLADRLRKEGLSPEVVESAPGRGSVFARVKGSGAGVAPDPAVAHRRRGRGGRQVAARSLWRRGGGRLRLGPRQPGLQGPHGHRADGAARSCCARACRSSATSSSPPRPTRRPAARPAPAGSWPTGRTWSPANGASARAAARPTRWPARPCTPA